MELEHPSGPRPTDRCDRCHSNVVWGQRPCPQCGAALDDDQLVAVFDTTDPHLLPLLKSVLSSADIPFSAQGESMLGVFPLPPAITSGLRGNLVAATIRVPRSRAGEALELLAGTGAEIDDEDWQR